MEALDYRIEPALMGGQITEISDTDIKVNLNGRLGVLHMNPYLMENKKVCKDDKVRFYFSYVQVTDNPLDYDYLPLKTESNVEPCLVGGTLEEVNDTAVKIRIGADAGTVAVPRRWIFTDKEPEVNDTVEFYLSRVQKV